MASKVLRQLCASRRGSTAFEFAIVAPLLFSMILGVVEYSFVIYGYSAMQGGANLAARAIAVNTLPLSSATTTVNDALPGWMAPATVAAVRTNAADASHSWITLTVTSSAINTTPIHLFTAAIPLTLTANVSVKQELPFDNVASGS